MNERASELVSNATEKENKIEMKRNQSDQLLLQISKLFNDTMDQQAKLNS